MRPPGPYIRLLGPCAICGQPSYRTASQRKRKTPGNYTCSAPCLSELKAREQRLRARPWQERFWERVAKSDGCWEWTGCVHPKTGYGMGDADGVTKSAHRMAYVLEYGAIPSGLQVLHHCDNRKCVRPSHLYAGTHADNMRDMVARGRSPRPLASPAWYPPRGEQNGNSRLTAGSIREIRQLLGTLTNTELGRNYGVSRNAILKIRTGQTWVGVT